MTGAAIRAFQERVWAHEIQLAEIAAGNQPNRTPGPKFLASRGIPTGVGPLPNRPTPREHIEDLFGSGQPQDFFAEQGNGQFQPGQRPTIGPVTLAQNVPPVMGMSKNLPNFLNQNKLKGFGNG
jgi:hypothetical protein